MIRRAALLAAALFIGGAVLAAPTPADAHRPPTDRPALTVRTWEPCANDEAAGGPCVWDARHMGNGQGRSFKVTARDRVRYVSHATAHALLAGERAA